VSKKILFTASTISHIENFHLPYLEEFKRLGWEVKAIALPVSKSFFSLKNLGAILSTSRLLKEEHFDVVSSHSTLAGIVTRLGIMLAGKKRLNVKVFHTAHGYLFHDDRSPKKWAYLLPEMLCGRVTDMLMVMNHEDLAIAKKYRLCGKSDKIHYINGMGIDLTKFQADPSDTRTREQKRKAFGLEPEDFVFVYAAEFSKRKNHELLLRSFVKAVTVLKDSEENNETNNADPLGLNLSGEPGTKPSSNRLKLVLAGDGALLEEMKTLAKKLDIENQVIFLGYTRNMNELYPCCDVAVTTSRIEGLPFNVMEAMACGLPVIASNIKGHQELIEHGVNGLLFESGDEEGLTTNIIQITGNHNLTKEFTRASLQNIQAYSISIIFPSIIKIYLQIIDY
jgi:glycosyltransferase EpsD